MFTNRISDLWKTAATDGASAPIGTGTSGATDELESMLDAWSIERSKCIESELLLDRSRKFLLRVLADGGISEKERREVRRLIRAIEQSARR